MPSRTTIFFRAALLSSLAVLPSAVHALTPSQVFDAVKDSVVVVKTLDMEGKQVSQGSGVLLPGGMVATNCHVIKDGASFKIGRGKQFVAATIYASDHDKDICLLDAKDFSGKPASLGKAASLKIGEPVYAVGAPKGLELSLSDGIVSQLRGSSPPFIQTTAAISPGSSGGGLFDSEARLVGFTTLYIDGGQSLNFAMPVEWLADIKPSKKIVSKQRNQIDWLTRAAALEEKKDWLGLLTWGKQWAKIEPDHSVAWFSIGRAHGGLNQPDQAIAAYRQALQINPDDASAWYNLGHSYDDIKRYDDAITAYRQVIRIDPDNIKAWSNIGISYSGLKRYDEAITAYRQVLRIDPEAIPAWNNLGIIYSDLKRYDNAIAAFHEVLRINPKDAKAWKNLGIIYYMSGNTSAALRATKSLRTLDPDRADELFNLIVPR